MDTAFELSQVHEAEKHKFTLENKKLLWHSSRFSTPIAALSHGLKIAPEQAPDSCFLFGKGIYFTDMASKALGSCYVFNNTALIFLCEVALGNIKKMKKFDCNAFDNYNKYDSALGCGFVFPNPNESKYIDEIEIPLGKPMISKEKVTKKYNLRKFLS